MMTPPNGVVMMMPMLCTSGAWPACFSRSNSVCSWNPESVKLIAPPGPKPGTREKDTVSEGGWGSKRGTYVP
jgi:hypothetical protein